MKPGLFAAVVVAVFLLGFAVGRTSVQPSSPASGPVASAPPMGMGMGGSRAMPSMPSGGSSMTETGQPLASAVTGLVSEVIQVPNYTYLHLTTTKGDEWAAVSSTPSVEKGQQVTIVNASMMSDFASSTLKRTFATIWFGQLQEGGGGAGAVAPSAGPSKASSPSSPATAGALAAIQKAEGPLGLRVSDVFSERQALAGKMVRVRGKVAKVSQVQGLTYVHVKDGSGSTASGDDDLTVVTQATVKADEVVTLEGRVAVDKDLGMGPRPVIVEDAKVLSN